MDLLPFELLDKIFSEACTDAGRTARSLRLLCRSASALVEPYRFRSVAITSPLQLKQFLETYRMASSAAVLSGIHHLFILARRDRDESDGQQIEDLITIAAPTLRTFTCLLDNGKGACIYDHVLTIPFPHLTHLTFSHPQRPNYPLVPEWLPKQPSCTFPNLRYLHILFGWAPLTATAHQGVSLFAARACPSKLLHVRVSGASFAGGTGLAALRVILGIMPKESYDGHEDIRPLPPSVTHYTVGVDTMRLSLMPLTMARIMRKAEEVRSEVEQKGTVKLALAPCNSNQTWLEEKQRWIEARSSEADAEEWLQDANAGARGWREALEACSAASKVHSVPFADVVEA